jgi:hypothetical protein
LFSSSNLVKGISTLAFQRRIGRHSRGLANVQYTHEHREPPRYGSLLRGVSGLHERQPKDLTSLVEQEDRFSVFFPLAQHLHA